MLEVGDRIVSGNQILIPIQFTISDQSKQIIAFYKKGDSRILIGRDLFETIRSDDELAAVLGHEIAHILQGESGAFGGGNIMNILVTAIYAPDAVQTSASLGASTKNFFKRSFTLNRESAADIRGLELMVKAGYNPTAMETILSKIMQDDGNLNRKGRKTYTERLELIHKAIEQNYPQSLLQ